MINREFNENPFEDPAYDRARYEEEREAIACGIDPYNSEYNIGVDSDDIFNRGIESVFVRARAKKRVKEVLDEEISYDINGYDDARRILNGFSRNIGYLRGLISRITGDGVYADSLDYRGLLREGYKIRGVAKKILGNRKN